MLLKSSFRPRVKKITEWVKVIEDGKEWRRIKKVQGELEPRGPFSWNLSRFL